MRKLSSEAEKIMIERFGKDTVISLATVEHEVPYVRNVNAYYEDGSFYIITYALSNKIKQIEKNPNVAIAGDWCIFRKNCASVPEERSAIPLQTEQSSAG